MAECDFAVLGLSHQQKRLRHLRRLYGTNLQLLIDASSIECLKDSCWRCYYTMHLVSTPSHESAQLLYTSEYSTNLDNPSWKPIAKLDRQLYGSVKEVLLTYWLSPGDNSDSKAVWTGTIPLSSISFLGDPLCSNSVPCASKSSDCSMCETKTDCKAAIESRQGGARPCFYFELFNHLQLQGGSTSGGFQVRYDLYCWPVVTHCNTQNGTTDSQSDSSNGNSHCVNGESGPKRPGFNSISKQQVVNVELKRTRVSCSADELRRLVVLAMRVSQLRSATSLLQSKIETVLGGSASLTSMAQCNRLHESLRHEEEARLAQRIADSTALRARLTRIVSACDACEARRAAADREAEETRSRVLVLLEARRTLRLRLEHTRAHLRERRRELVVETARVYPIIIGPTVSTIRGVYLLNSADLENVKSTSETLQTSVALGFTVQLVELLSAVYGVKMRYPLRFFGSRSSAVDPITDMRMLDERNDSVPLYVSRNVNRDCYKYALYLLSEDIEVLRYHLKRPPATDSGHLLLSLYQLIDSIIRERPRFTALARLAIDARRFQQLRMPSSKTNDAASSPTGSAKTRVRGISLVSPPTSPASVPPASALILLTPSEPTPDGHDDQEVHNRFQTPDQFSNRSNQSVEAADQHGTT